MKNIISHNCVGARLYQLKNRQYGNPFMWCVVPPEDFYYLYEHYQDIDFTKIELKTQDGTKVLTIDGKVNVFYVHYRYDENEEVPVKKSGIDVYFRRIDRYIIKKYRERLERMKNEPVFVVTDREFFSMGQFNMKKQDLFKYVNKPNCIVAVYDRSIVGKNVVYLPAENMDPSEIARIILSSQLSNLLL